MNAWQQMFVQRLPSLHLPVMEVAFQSPVGVQAVSSYRAAWFDRFADKTMQHFSAGRLDTPHANSADARSVFFRRHDDQGFFLGLSADYSLFLTAPVGFIDFHRTLEAIPSGTHHRTSKFVQQGPRRLIAAQSQHALEGQGTSTVLLARDAPHGSEPEGKRQMAVLKDRPRSDRSLMTTTATEPQPPRRFPGLRALAPGANKAFRPPQPKQVVPTGLVRGKAAFKVHQRLRIFLNHAPTLPVGVG